MVKYHLYTVLGSHFGFMQIGGLSHHGNKYIPSRFLVPLILLYFTLKLYVSSGDMTEIVFSWPLWKPFLIYANKGFA